MVTYSPFYKNPNHWFKVVLKNPDSEKKTDSQDMETYYFHTEGEIEADCSKLYYYVVRRFSR